MALYRNAVSPIKSDSDCDLYGNRLQCLLYDFYLFAYLSPMRYSSNFTTINSSSIGEHA